MCVLLQVSCYFLLGFMLFESHADYAHDILCRFVGLEGNIYGTYFLVYSVYGLIHLANDVKVFGRLIRIHHLHLKTFLAI